ncbi:Ser/Thr protein phosphatase family protein [Synechococcus sp. PCC 7335]|uniref:metallophosphoesterase n=1 Tax=Synechococcus sp. (strain ATCC 29403 / PCC 7335) TaxID=91464 RepID=UPI00017EB14D|nr:metallophosphoesterase [Synechococcus sp. PCC 7335]EDX86504.1 Ser/Thr protein phosphatase family protein [Synechococcus sp. PCC 7335]
MHRLLSGALSVDAHTIPIRDLPARLSGIVIVQLSDFHFDGLRLSDQLLAKTIAKVEDIEPDLITLTGDFVTRSPDPIHELVRRIKALPSQYGTIAVLGNHDISVPGAKETVTQVLERGNISVLWNAIATPFGEDFPVVGFADLWSGEFDTSILDQIPPTTPRLVLSHNPDTAEPLSKYRVDLQLSGHTHGGQVYLPGLGPGPQVWERIRHWVPSIIRNRVPFLSDRCFQVARNWEWCRGLHQVENNWLYVNRGLGTYFPGRFMCSPELTVITLVTA